MGYTRKRKTFVLEFENEDGEFAGLEVEVTSLPMGEFLEFSTLAGKKDMGDADVHRLLKAFTRVLVRWNVEEEDGTPVPANLDGLLSMDLEFNLKLIGAWMKVVSPPAEGSELGKGSSSGESFPGRPLTMEAL